MMANQISNHNYVNRAEDLDKSLANSRVSVNPDHCQTVIKQSGNHKHDFSYLVAGMLVLCMAEQGK